MLPANFKVVILSRKRADTIGQNTLALMPYATITVEQSELADYKQLVPAKQLLPHPKFPTMAHLRNWINEQFANVEFLYHVHDDLTRVRCLVGWHERRYRDPVLIAQLLERTAICAREAGAFMFGFGNIPAGTAHYRKEKPFKLNGYIRNVMGFRAGHGLSWDPAILGQHDVDVGMQSLLEHRIIWRDERWTFDDARLASNTGGMAGIRTSEMLAEGRANLLDKWGTRYVNVKPRSGRGQRSGTEATIVTVRRRDPAVKGS